MLGILRCFEADFTLVYEIGQLSEIAVWVSDYNKSGQIVVIHSKREKQEGMNNVGQLDSLARVVLAVVISTISVIGSVSGVWLLVSITGSLLLVATAVAKLCPIYAFLHVSSNKVSY